MAYDRDEKAIMNQAKTYEQALADFQENQRQHEQDRLDAQRYRKLRDKAENGGYLDTRDWNWERANDTPTLDSAVDALDPNENSNRSR